MANYAIVENGKEYNVLYYNLKMVLSLGYRVKSVKATKFRIWATKQLEELIEEHYSSPPPPPSPSSPTLLTPAEAFLQQAQLMVQFEQRLRLSDDRITKIENTQHFASENLKRLPEPSTMAPALTTRICVKKIVENYSNFSGCGYQEIYNTLYREINLRCKTNLRLLQRNEQKARGGKMKSLLQIVEDRGLMEMAYAIAKDIFFNVS